MRALLLILLLANLLLLGTLQGWFGQWSQAGREPGRAERQIEPQSIRLLTDADLRKLREAGSTAERKDAADCVELGDFAPDVAPRVLERLMAMNPGTRITSLSVESPGWYMVYLAPLKTRTDAEKLAEDLRGRGLRDLMVIEDNSPLRNGISLGQFKDQDLAQKHLADLERRGIKGVRLLSRSSGSATRLQIQSPDAVLVQLLPSVQKEFGATRLAPCGS